MVSLSAVEELASELWPAKPIAVAALPDARKGERLVMLTSEPGATRDVFGRFAKSRGANDLMVPAEVYVVETVPLLGSGKVDFVASTKLAVELSQTQQRKPQPIVAAE